ncbi:unnamed protein product [Ixodes pacificus]
MANFAACLFALADCLFARFAAFFRSLSSSAVYWRGRPRCFTAEVATADGIDAFGAAMSRSGCSAGRECGGALRGPPWLVDDCCTAG